MCGTKTKITQNNADTSKKFNELENINETTKQVNLKKYKLLNELIIQNKYIY